MTVEVIVQDVRSVDDTEVLPSREQFSQWANLALSGDKLNAQLTVRIVDSQEIRALNSRYRSRDIPTNILSFYYDDEPLFSQANIPNILGDLVICADVVRQEAAERQCPVENHWAHLTLHGVLHLLGYNHETRRQAAEMERLEIRLLETLNIQNPYEVFNNQA